MPAFAPTIGIDYSGAQVPTAGLNGPRVHLAEDEAMPAEVLPPPPLPISPEDIEFLCWLGIESDGEGTLLQMVGSGK